MLRRAVLLVAAIAMSAHASPAVANELRSDALRLCYRSDAQPFSFVGEDGKPDGYSISLCRMMADELGVAELSRQFMEVNAENRFEALGNHRCDVLCEATTITLARRARFEFSLITFVTGSTILYRQDLFSSKLAEGPYRIGLLRGTTVHQALLRGALKTPSETPVELVVFDSHNEGRTALSDGRIAGYIADREILLGIKEQLGEQGETMTVARSLLSYEPYGIAFRIGDDRLRLAMDSVLARLFRSGEIEELLKAYFPAYEVSPRLRDFFEMQAIPE